MEEMLNSEKELRTIQKSQIATEQLIADEQLLKADQERRTVEVNHKTAEVNHMTAEEQKKTAEEQRKVVDKQMNTEKLINAVILNILTTLISINNFFIDI